MARTMPTFQSGLRRNSRPQAEPVVSRVPGATGDVGGSGGRGVLVAKEPGSGKWVGPAFYTLAAASVGF